MRKELNATTRRALHAMQKPPVLTAVFAEGVPWETNYHRAWNHVVFSYIGHIVDQFKEITGSKGRWFYPEQKAWAFNPAFTKQVVQLMQDNNYLVSWLDQSQTPAYEHHPAFPAFADGASSQPPPPVQPHSSTQLAQPADKLLLMEALEACRQVKQAHEQGEGMLNAMLSVDSVLAKTDLVEVPSDTSPF